jgi:hypothetical protein
MRGSKRRLWCLCMAWALVPFAPMSPAFASPWAEVGDAQLRSDVEILAAAGVIDDITTHWPIPWKGIYRDLEAAGSLNDQPAYVRAAAERLMRRARAETHSGLKASANVDATNLPSVVYGFDGLGRGEAQAQGSLEYMTNSSAVRLSAGVFSPDLDGHGSTFTTINGVPEHIGNSFMPDGSYAAQTIGDALVYGGYITHWWGPGWISALSLSNNARPFPQIGIERNDTASFSTPWLSWLGPWQAEFFVGILNGERVAKDTLYDGLRLTFNPLPGLEIGIARTDEACGEGQPCKPLSTYFDLQNTPQHPSLTNDEGDIDIHYTNTIGGQPFEVYGQVMNEDSNPVIHSDSSHLFGASTWIPAGQSTVRLTLEYTNSIATANIFSFGDYLYGNTYNDYKYTDGMRYDGRTLGFSLDSDSRLLSLQGGWSDSEGRAYELTFDRAQISSPSTGLGNIVTTAPVTVDLGEARITLPFRDVNFVIAGRLQDDQPRPDHGFAASIETGLHLTF